ncbi:MAG: T9SS type A sorting domain-containing protein [Flavobacteriales bacterium]|nr:MAG: T9SS type A sorting domain-containing protein [Flavobacteriales bacterium]
MKNLLYTLLFTVTFYTNAQEVNLELFKDGFTSPVDIQNAGDDRLFIVEQAGIIKILNQDATINPEPFLNITSLISSGGERGLLGLAFHPDYSNNGYFFVNYTNTTGDTQVARYTVDANDSNIADPNTAVLIIDADQPYSNHNGGCIQFGADGFLYIGLGDGGSGGDPENRSQNLQTLLGKILRIDINNSNGANNYDIPSDNPFVGDSNALDEIWAYGVRNPWRFSFDSESDELWIADVGQGDIEEINRVAPDAAGLNYGWRCYEGSQTYNTTGCPDPSELTFPVAEYTHSVGYSITGGYVYHGNIYSDIQDLYFFADLNGLIGTVDNDNNLINYGNYGGTWVSFGGDVNGELYIADISGSIHKVKGGEIFDTQSFSESQVSITPNPTSNNIRISLDGHLISKIDIIDLKGAIVFSEKNLSVPEKNISLESMKSGVYIVKILSDNGHSIFKKIIIN